MQYIHRYSSPMGGILLSADSRGLTGLWFDGQKHFSAGLDTDRAKEEPGMFSGAIQWLEVYFSGRQPDFTPPLHLTGTDFQLAVWRLLLEIPYGVTTTYGTLARRLAAQHGLPQASARAVGGAVGRNRISLIVPCHRIVGAGGSLTGYAGGVDRKAALLQLEGAEAGRPAPLSPCRKT